MAKKQARKKRKRRGPIDWRKAPSGERFSTVTMSATITSATGLRSHIQDALMPLWMNSEFAETHKEYIMAQIMYTIAECGDD